MEVIIIAASDSKRMKYVSPLTKVVEMVQSSILCQSSATRKVDEDDSYLNNF